MDTLFSKSEETYAKCIVSSMPLDRHVIALSKVTDFVLTSNIPVFLRPHVIIRALRILRNIEAEENLLDLCFARLIPHPDCGLSDMSLGELWELPREYEWLCGDCGRPLYHIQTDKI